MSAVVEGRRGRGAARCSRDDLGRLGRQQGGTQLADDLLELWDLDAQKAALAGMEMRQLAKRWVDMSAPGADLDEADLAALHVALALNISESTAAHRIDEAHVAVADLPRLFSLLEASELPLAWLHKVVRAVRRLAETQRHEVDAEVSAWDLGCTTDQFVRRLRLLITRIRSQEPLPAQQKPAALRRIDVFPADEEGMACLQLVGPAPAIQSLYLQVNTTARAIQAEQRARLAQHREAGGELGPLGGTCGLGAGTETGTVDGAIPYDDGSVLETGRAMSLAKLSFDLLARAALDPDGARVPVERFRINVTVPAMTLLGASDEPGLLDGTTPIPADMARSLAAGEDTWHRILTDPASGAFLPLPSQRYAPTKPMLEHLRLRGSTCAVPTCSRPSSWASECDHIEEYNHHDPESGGQTEIENLHLLCWQHHQAKTRGDLDPTRISRPPGEPGATRWATRDGTVIDASDDVDDASPRVVAELNGHWNAHLRFEREREKRKRRAEQGMSQSDEQGPPPF